MKVYLKHEILNSYSWIKVKRFEDDAKLSDADRLTKLKEHHEAETAFLIRFIRDIVSGNVDIVEYIKIEE